MSECRQERESGGERRRDEDDDERNAQARLQLTALLKG